MIYLVAEEEALVIIMALFLHEGHLIYIVVLMCDIHLIYFIVIIWNHVHIVLGVFDYRISNIVFLINNIQKKSGIKRQMKYFQIWNLSEFLENSFQHI